MKMKERDCRLDYARATAVLMMLLQHVLIYLHSSNYTVTYVSAALIEFLMMITKSAVPLFIIITGSLLLDSERDFPYQKGIKLAWRMIKIIAIWNVINAIYFYFNDGLKVAAGKMVYGNYWYLYMLVGLYLLMPIINPILRNYKKSKIPYYIIILTFAYEFWLSYALLLPEIVYNHASKFVGKFMFSIITGYTGFLFLGYIFRNDFGKIDFSSIKTKVLGIFFSISALILLVYAIIVAVKNNEYNYVYFDEFTAFTIGGIIFYIFQNHVPREIGGGISSVFQRVLLFIGTHSLGIYVVSNILLDVYKRNTLAIEQFLFLPLGILICLLLLAIPSCLIVWILSKTSLKWLV